MFSPLGFPNGRVTYDMRLAAPDDHLFALYDLEPHRQCLAVLALTSYKDIDNIALSSGVDKLRKKYPRALIHKILVFGVPSQDALEGTKNIIPILSSKVSSNFTSVESAMTDITSDFLAELAVYTISKQMGSFKSPTLKGLESPEPSRKSDKPFNSSLRHRVMNSSTSGFRAFSMGTNTASGGEGGGGGSKSSMTRTTSVSKTGSISLGLNDRSKSKQKGRSLKFLGDMYLLAGRLSDAMREYTEAASILKSTFDHLWFASCLECVGICLVLLAYLEIPSAIPSVVLATVHGTSSTSHAAHHESTSSLSLSLHNSHSSSDSLSISRTASPIETTNSTIPSASSATSSGQPSLEEFLPQLTDTISRYYGRSQLNSEESVPQLVYCEFLLRFAKLQSLVRLCGGWNGALLSAIVKETPITSNINENSPSSSKVAQWCAKVFHTELSNLPIIAQCQIYSGLAGIYSSLGFIRKKNLMLRELLLALDPKKSSDNKDVILMALANLDNSYPSGLVGLLDEIAKVYAAGDLGAIGCGWVEIKNSFLKTAISLCDSVSNYSGVIYFATVLLCTSADLLSKEEQLTLHGMMHNAMDAARRSGLGNLVTSHWDPYMLRDITLLPSTTLSPTLETINNTNDVFLHNPFIRRDPASDSKYLVQNERAEFIIRLQNPFEFEIHISALLLICGEGSTIDGQLSNVYVAPLSIQEVVLPVIPRIVGHVKITGCRITILGHEPREFFLAENNVPRMEVKTKKVGVNSGSAIKKLQEQALIRRSLDLSVIPAQPVISIGRTSWDQGWFMLLEGEKQIIRFTLENFSNVQVNTLRFSFFDSTSEPLQSALANRDLPLNEVYECEYFLYKRHTMHLITSTREIKPKTSEDFEVELLGKRGMVSASVQIDYGSSKETGSIWTRRITLPIQTTVSSSIELGGCDIISLPNLLEPSEFYSNSLKTFFNNLIPAERPHYFLLVLDLRNSWSQAMDIKVWSKDGSNHLLELESSAMPSRNIRLLLPFKWPGVDYETAISPIPKLGKRQYLVDTNTNQIQIKQMRESFWYREKLLECIGGTWNLSKSDRRGFIEFRGLRLTPRMINLLRSPVVSLTMTILSINEKDPCQINDRQWQISVEDENYFLRTTIINKSKAPLRGILRLIPSVEENNMEAIDSKLIYNGLLQQQVTTIPCGESLDIDTGFIYVVKGNYVWTSQFETLEGEQYFQKRPINVKAV